MASRPRHSRYRGEDLERLRILPYEGMKKDRRKYIRQRLRATIKFAEETNRPDRAEWATILLKKFSQPVSKGGNDGGAKVPE